MCLQAPIPKTKVVLVMLIDSPMSSGVQHQYTQWAPMKPNEVNAPMSPNMKDGVCHHQALGYPVWLELIDLSNLR